jgi:hypothetical protein
MLQVGRECCQDTGHTSDQTKNAVAPVKCPPAIRCVESAPCARRSPAEREAGEQPMGLKDRDMIGFSLI